MVSCYELRINNHVNPKNPILLQFHYAKLGAMCAVLLHIYVKLSFRGGHACGGCYIEYLLQTKSVANFAQRKSIKKWKIT